MAEIETNSQDRTEQPTSLRLDEARRRGIVPRSSDLASAGVLLAGFALLAMLGGRLLEALTRMMREMLGWSSGPAPLDGLWQVVTELALLLGGLVVVAVLVNLAQVGLLSAWQRAAPDLERVSPGASLRRLLSLRGAAATAMALAKLAAVAALAYVLIGWWLAELAATSSLSPGDLAGRTGGLIVRLSLAVGAVLTGLAVLDLLFQRWQHRRDLMMTRREVMEDLKRMEGDPTLRRLRRRRANKLLLDVARPSWPGAAGPSRPCTPADQAPAGPARPAGRRVGQAAAPRDQADRT